MKKIILILCFISTFAYANNEQKITLDNGYKVWTKRVGNGPTKILTLHGGPGCSHEYFVCLEKILPLDKFEIIYYDQLGSYQSDQPVDDSLWTVERFREEVEQVRQVLELEDFYLFGHSWGSMLAIEYALKYQDHLKGLILSNMTASISSYENYLQELRASLPEEIQQQLTFFEDTNDILHPDYTKIMFEEVYTRFICRINPFPDPVLQAFSHLNMDVYQTMQGPNEFIIIGNFKDWDRWGDLSSIKVPTLLIGGKYDTMNPADIVKMGTLIPNATVKICENGSHLAMYDDQESYFDAVKGFFKRLDLY